LDIDVEMRGKKTIENLPLTKDNKLILLGVKNERRGT
jgi:hypothetical protein